MYFSFARTNVAKILHKLSEEMLSDKYSLFVHPLIKGLVLQPIPGFPDAIFYYSLTGLWFSSKIPEYSFLKKIKK